jgi:hypothetical protein
MGQHFDSADVGPEAAQLLTVARQLREAATRAGRLDVAAKADEAIVLIAGTNDSADGNEQKSDRDGKSNTVLKILDGLGF